MNRFEPPFDSRQLRNALGRFPTGVTVITTCSPEGKHEGLTANSFAALSLDPPLVLWSMALRAQSLPSFRAAGQFAISVLAAGQTELSHHFATPRADKFAGVAMPDGIGGCKLVPGALAVFECTTEQALDIGDHVLFIGRVRRFGYADGAPLAFNAGQYGTVLPTKRGDSSADLESSWGGLG